MSTTSKALNKIHIIAMARQAGLAFQDADATFLNDLAGEKEVLAFARLIERHVLSLVQESALQQ